MSPQISSVGVNLLWLRPGEVGGSETYARRILRAVATHYPELSLHLFGTAPGVNAVHPDVGATVVAHESGTKALTPARRAVVERTWLREESKTTNLSVMHHLGGTVPVVSETPTVVTIHDLQPLDDPSNFAKTKVRFLQRAIPQAISRAAIVTTPSEWVRNQVVERFDLSPDQVLAVSAFAEPITLAAVAVGEDGGAALRGIAESGPIVLYPAMTLNHKNHSGLFEAFDRAAQRDPEVQLVCVGSPGRDHQEICEAAEATSPRIHMLGHVSKSDLDFLYREADVVVFPSRYEGFGLPVLEAQHYGVPVICSNATALPEVAGTGAVLLDPENVADWADALATRFSPREREAMVASGLRNAQRYSVAATAEQQWRAYELATA